MTIQVTIHDDETDETEVGELDLVSHILVTNEAAGYHLTGQTFHANGTIQLTLKVDRDQLAEHRKKFRALQELADTAVES